MDYYTTGTFLNNLIFWCKRNVRLKIVASGCDQCVWTVGVVAGVVTGWGIE